MNGKKVIALITLACFITSFIVRDAVAAFTDAPRVPASVNRALEELVIPSSFGTITDGRFFGSKKVVITLQDLHCHPEVQRNIARILSLLQQKYSFSTVYVEGASGDISTAWLSGIRNARFKTQIVESLVDRGRLTGEEYYAVLSRGAAQLRGVENESAHRENIVRLGKILSRQTRYDAVLAGMRQDLTATQKSYLSVRNSRFNALLERYRNGKITAGRYYERLLKNAEGIRNNPSRFGTVFTISPENYPTITAYLALQESGRQLNYRRISTQLSRFLNDLKHRLPYSVYARLVQKTGQFSQQEELYLYLARIAKEESIDVGICYPDLKEFFAYLEQKQSFNPLTLLAEEQQLIESIRLGLSEDVADLEVSFLVDFLGCYEDYLKNRLQDGEYDYFVQRFDRFTALWRKYIPDSAVEELAADYPLLNDYYRVNRERNNYFIANILGQAPSAAGRVPAVTAEAFNGGTVPEVMASLDNGSEAVVVVTGGFHTGGLSRLLRERGISYLAITPHVTTDAEHPGEVYRTLALEQSRMMSSALRLVPLSAQFGPEQVTALVEALEPLFKEDLTRGSIERVMNELVNAWNTNEAIADKRKEVGDAGALEYEYAGGLGDKEKHEIILRFTGTKRELHFIVDGTRKRDRIRLDKVVPEQEEQAPAAPVVDEKPSIDDPGQSETGEKQATARPVTKQSQAADSNRAAKQDVLRMMAISLARDQQQIEKKVLAAIEADDKKEVEKIAAMIGLLSTRKSSRFLLFTRETQLKDELAAAWNSEGKTEVNEIIRILNRYRYRKALLEYYRSYADKHKDELQETIEQQIRSSFISQGYDEQQAAEFLADGIDWRLVRGSAKSGNLEAYATKRYGEAFSQFNIARLTDKIHSAVKMTGARGKIPRVLVSAVVTISLLGIELANSLFLRYPGSVFMYYYWGRGDDVYLSRESFVRVVVDDIAGQVSPVVTLRVPLANVSVRLIDAENGRFSGARAKRLYRYVRRLMYVNRTIGEPLFVYAAGRYLKSRAEIYFWTIMAVGSLMLFLQASPLFIVPFLAGYSYKLHGWAKTIEKVRSENGQGRALKWKIIAVGTLVWVIPLALNFMGIPVLSLSLQGGIDWLLQSSMFATALNFVGMPVLDLGLQGAIDWLSMFATAILPGFVFFAIVRPLFVAVGKQYVRFVRQRREALFDTRLFEKELQLSRSETAPGVREFVRTGTDQKVPWSFKGDTLIAYLESLDVRRHDAAVVADEIKRNALEQEMDANIRVIRAALYHDEQMRVRHQIIRASDVQKAQIRRLIRNMVKEPPPFYEPGSGTLKKTVKELSAQAEAETLLDRNYWKTVAVVWFGMWIANLEMSLYSLPLDFIDEKLSWLFRTEINVFKGLPMLFHGTFTPLPSTGLVLYTNDDWLGQFAIHWGGAEGLFYHLVDRISIRFPALYLLVDPGRVRYMAQHNNISLLEAADTVASLRNMGHGMGEDISNVRSESTIQGTIAGNGKNYLIQGAYTNLTDPMVPDMIKMYLFSSGQEYFHSDIQVMNNSMGKKIDWEDIILTGWSAGKTELPVPINGRISKVTVITSNGDILPFRRSGTLGEKVEYDYVGRVSIGYTIDIYEHPPVVQFDNDLPRSEIENMPQAWKDRLDKVKDQSDEEKIKVIDGIMADYFVYDFYNHVRALLWGLRDWGRRVSWTGAADHYVSEGQPVPVMCLESSFYYVLLARYAGLKAFLVGVDINEGNTFMSRRADHVMAAVEVNGHLQLEESTKNLKTITDTPAILPSVEKFMLLGGIGASIITLESLVVATVTAWERKYFGRAKAAVVQSARRLAQLLSFKMTFLDARLDETAPEIEEKAVHAQLSDNEAMQAIVDMYGDFLKIIEDEYGQRLSISALMIDLGNKELLKAFSVFINGGTVTPPLVETFIKALTESRQAEFPGSPGRWLIKTVDEQRLREALLQRHALDNVNAALDELLKIADRETPMPEKNGESRSTTDSTKQNGRRDGPAAIPGPEKETARESEQIPEKSAIAGGLYTDEQAKTLAEAIRPLFKNVFKKRAVDREMKRFVSVWNTSGEMRETRRKTGNIAYEYQEEKNGKHYFAIHFEKTGLELFFVLDTRNDISERDRLSAAVRDDRGAIEAKTANEKEKPESIPEEKEQQEKELAPSSDKKAPVKAPAENVDTEIDDASFDEGAAEAMEPRETEADIQFRYNVENDNGRSLIQVYVKGDDPLRRPVQIAAGYGDGRFRLAQEMSIAYPRGTGVTGDRSELQLNPAATRAIEKLIDRLTDLPDSIADREDSYSGISEREIQLNTLVQMFRKMQAGDAGDNGPAAAALLQYAADRARKPGGLLDYYKENGVVVLPNRTVWRGVAPFGKKVVYLDESLYRFREMLDAGIFREIPAASLLYGQLPKASKIFTAAFDRHAAASPMIIETVDNERYVFVNEDVYNGLLGDRGPPVEAAGPGSEPAAQPAPAAPQRPYDQAKEAVLRAAAISLFREDPDGIEQKILRAVKEQDLDAVAALAGQLRMRTTRFGIFLIGKKITLTDELRGAGGMPDATILNILKQYGYPGAIYSYYLADPQLRDKEALLEQQIVDSLVRQRKGYDEKKARTLLENGIDWQLVQSRYERANFAAFTMESFGEIITRFNIGRLLREITITWREGRLQGGVPGLITMSAGIVGVAIAGTVFFLLLRYPFSVYMYFYGGRKDSVYLPRDAVFRLVMDDIEVQENPLVSVRVPLLNRTVRFIDGNNGLVRSDGVKETYRSLRRAGDRLRSIAEHHFVLAAARYLHSRAVMYFWIAIVAGSLISFVLGNLGVLWVSLVIISVRVISWADLAREPQPQGTDKRKWSIIAASLILLVVSAMSYYVPVAGVQVLGSFAFIALRLFVGVSAMQFFRFAGSHRQTLFDQRLFEDELQLPPVEGHEGERGFIRVDTGRFVSWSFKGDTMIAYLESLAGRRDNSAMPAAERSTLERNLGLIEAALHHDEQSLVRYRIVQADEVQKKQIRRLLTKLMPDAPPINTSRKKQLNDTVSHLGKTAEMETVLDREYWKTIVGVLFGVGLFAMEYVLFLFAAERGGITGFLNGPASDATSYIDARKSALAKAEFDTKIEHLRAEIQGADSGNTSGPVMEGATENVTNVTVPQFTALQAGLENGNISNTEIAARWNKGMALYYESVSTMNENDKPHVMAFVNGDRSSSLLQNMEINLAGRTEPHLRTTVVDGGKVVASESILISSKGEQDVQLYERLFDGKISDVRVINDAGENVVYDRYGDRGQNLHIPYAGHVIIYEKIDIYDRQLALSIEGNMQQADYDHMPQEWKVELDKARDKTDVEKIRVVHKIMAEYFTYDYNHYLDVLRFAKNDDAGQERWMSAADLYVSSHKRVPVTCTQASLYFSELLRYTGFTPEKAFVVDMETEYGNNVTSANILDDDVDHAAVAVFKNGRYGIVESLDDVPTASDAPDSRGKPTGMNKPNQESVGQIGTERAYSIADNQRAIAWMQKMLSIATVTALLLFQSHASWLYWNYAFAVLIMALVVTMLYTNHLQAALSANENRPEDAKEFELDLEQLSGADTRAGVQNMLEARLGEGWEHAVDAETVVKIAGELKAKGAARIRFVNAMPDSSHYAETEGTTVRFLSWIAAPGHDPRFDEPRRKLVDMLVMHEGYRLSFGQQWPAKLQTFAIFLLKPFVDIDGILDVFEHALNPRWIAERLSLAPNVQNERFAKAAEQREAEEGAFNKSMIYLAADPADREKVIANAAYGNDRGVHTIAIAAGAPMKNAVRAFTIETDDGDQLPVYVQISRGALVFTVEARQFSTAVAEIVKTVNGFGKFGGDDRVLEMIRKLYAENRMFGALEFDKISLAPRVIIDYNGTGKPTADEKDVAYRMLLDNVVFVAVQSKGRRLETTADRRYDLVIESGTSPDTLLNIYFRESVLRHAADSVIRGRAVIAEKNISEKDISIGLGAYVDKLAKQNEDAAGILLKTGEQEYGAYVKKVVVALHKKDRKVYGSFTAANEADIRNMAPQINTGEKGRGKRKAMLQRFDGAVINMAGAELGDMERLLRLLRQNVRTSALLVVIPPAALPVDDAALQYARDNGIYLNMNLTSVATSVEAIKGFDSGYIGSGLDLEETDRDRISRFFGDVLPQLPFKVLIVNADELESRLPPGLLDNALLKTALFKILAIREKGPEEIAADQRKLVFALKEKQLQDERTLLDQYLQAIEQMRNRKDGENVVVPEAWRGNSIVAYQMKKLEGNPEAQQVLLEATAGRLLLMNEREKDVKNMERLNTGFVDPAVESLLAEALLERELLERATGWQARDAEDVPISMPEAISAAVAIDNYMRVRSRVMRSPAPAKERQQAIEELIAVIKKNADPKVIKTLEMKNIDSAAYKALLSAA